MRFSTKSDRIVNWANYDFFVKSINKVETANVKKNLQFQTDKEVIANEETDQNKVPQNTDNVIPEKEGYFPICLYFIRSNRKSLGGRKS